jgi:hypothetical protein
VDGKEYHRGEHDGLYQLTHPAPGLGALLLPRASRKRIGALLGLARRRFPVCVRRGQPLLDITCVYGRAAGGFR